MSDVHRSNRESTLFSMGLTTNSQSKSGGWLEDVVQGDTSLAFSGYGEFTPITVKSETVLKDAYLE